jgi:hypothetical protein
LVRGLICELMEKDLVWVMMVFAFRSQYD